MTDAFWIALPGSIAAIVGGVNIYLTHKSKKQSVDNATAIKEVKDSVIEVKGSVIDVHDSVNGKMEKLLAVSKVADTATGKAEGKAEEKQDQKDRDDKKNGE